MLRSLPFSSPIRYTLRRSYRAKHMRLSVHRDGAVTLSLPLRTSLAAGEKFVARHARWIAKKVAAFQALPPAHPAARYGRREYLQYREPARALALSRIAVFKEMLGVAHGRVSIRNARTCWGSCSQKGNLNFNYKIVFLPPHLADYVIVHELAHLREMSHSQDFWALVGSVVGDPAARRRELRGMRML